MEIMQTFYLTFANQSLKKVIIHEHRNKFVMMITDDGWFRYFPENDKPKIYNTADEAFKEISKLWKFSEALRIETTNEFIKIEKLREIFKCDIKHI